MKIGIASVGLGNIGSVANMIRSIGYEPTLLNKPPSDHHDLDVIFLPGVGSYDQGVASLKQHGWYTYLKDFAHSGTNSAWLVGICLGMQLLCKSSEEGSAEGLGIIPGSFKKFIHVPANRNTIKVPHMGWNRVAFDSDKAPWATSLPVESRFYFVHSYYYCPDIDSNIAGYTTHGVRFGSVITGNRVIGFQFHPEKSHRFGKALLNAVLKHIFEKEK